MLALPGVKRKGFEFLMQFVSGFNIRRKNQTEQSFVYPSCMCQRNGYCNLLDAE